MISDKMGTWTYLFICTLCLLSTQKAYGDVPMTILQSAVAEGAVCLDGSPPAYHLSPGSGSGANNWIVHMEGGGWCRNTQECLARRDTFRGSSMHMQSLSFSGILGGSQSSNPNFYNWNRVKIRYCDGSSFTGDVEDVDPNTNLHYRGGRLWLAVIEDLLAKGMNNAQNALLSGCSAGGLASILHCDRFRDLLPAGAKVRCLSDAGYFIDAKDISGSDSIKSFYSDVVNTHGSAKNLPSSCTSRFPANMCFFPQYVVPQMSTPLFVLNSAYDAWQIRNILAPSSADPSKSWASCKLDIKKCSSDQLQTLQGYRTQFLDVLPVSGGMFIDSCHVHCQSGSKDTWQGTGPFINSTTIGQAVGDWFYDRDTSQKIDCPYPCNPSCPNNIEE